jgi:hypothetical protein
VSTIANRHRNIERHSRRLRLAAATTARLQDIGFCLMQVLRGDREAVEDVLAAWRRVAHSRQMDRERRAALR